VCLHAPERFETDLGAFTGTNVAVSNCGSDNVSGVNCSDDDGGNPDVMRFFGATTARARITGIDATGFTDLEIHLAAGFSPFTDPGEDIDAGACCDTGAGCSSAFAGAALNADGGGSDAWLDRGPFSLAPATFDGCPHVNVDLTFVSTTTSEGAHVDDFAVSGVGVMTVPLTDNGDGTYGGSFAACEAATVTVTCEWVTPGGVFSDSVDVTFN
jgi:hypothetical protein